MSAVRAVRLAALPLAALPLARLSRRGPALVVDVDSGKVLHAERATDPWFPASITKLMTTYVALDQVRSGRASIETAPDRVRRTPPPCRPPRWASSPAPSSGSTTRSRSSW